MRERYRRSDFGHLQVEVTFTDPGPYAKPWGFTANMALEADTEMLASICERTSDHWSGSLADAANTAVTVAPDVLARYVGVYSGFYLANKRTVEVSLSGGQLIAKIIGAAAVDGGEMRPDRPRGDSHLGSLTLPEAALID